MKKKTFFIKHGIVLAAYVLSLALSVSSQQVRNTNAYVFFLSEQCVNTFTGSISDEVTTTTSTVPTTEAAESTMGQDTTETCESIAESSANQDGQYRNTEKISPQTGSNNISALAVSAAAAAFAAIIVKRKTEKS